MQTAYVAPTGRVVWGIAITTAFEVLLKWSQVVITILETGQHNEGDKLIGNQH